MKARLLAEKEVLEFRPGTTEPLAPPALVQQCVRRDGRLYAPAGTILDDPECYWIVLMGQAEAWDDECAARTKCSPQQLEARLHAARRLAAGIEQEDFPLYDAGYIAGYDEKGDFLPGPKWDEYVAKQADGQAGADEGI